MAAKVACPVCGKEYTRSGLPTHMRTHSVPPDKAAKGKTWVCASCGTHYDIRPRPCPRCGSGAANYMDQFHP